MFKTLVTAFVLASGPLMAQSTVADWKADPARVFAAQDVEIGDFLWQARPLVIFAASPLDPAFGEQLELLQAEIQEVLKRDIVIITDTDPANPSQLRESLRPRGFVWVLIGKDGEIKLRKPFAWDMRELGRVIDKMPLRKREIDRE